MKFAFIFPGQGCQSVGMGREFYENSDPARALLDEASSFTGIDFKNLLFEPNDKLDVSEFTQPAIALNSMMALAALQEKLDQEKLNIAPQFLLGHSLGEFSALSAAGGIEPKQMLKLVNIRGRLMQSACELLPTRRSKKFARMRRAQASRFGRRIITAMDRSWSLAKKMISQRLRASLKPRAQSAQCYLI